MESTPTSTVTVSIETRRTYDVRIEDGCFDRVPEILGKFDPVSSVVLVTDRNVYSLYAAALEQVFLDSGRRTIRFVMDPSRQKKTLETANEMFKLLFEERVDRDALMLVVGGGTVGDIGGLVAALYLRGIRYVHVPTTLIGQADSSIGGKVNANFGPYLNSLSVFYHPAAILIDPGLIETLPLPEYRSGLAEIVKYAVAMDFELFERLERSADALNQRERTVVYDIINHCVRCKANIVSADSTEAGRFQLFNYGHEFGHAIEASYNYCDLLHGEAVSIGMHTSAWLAWQAGVVDESVFVRQGRLLKALNLVREIPSELRDRLGVPQLRESVARLLGSDKKRRAGGQVWIVPCALGDAVTTTSIPPSLITEAISKLAEGGIPCG